MFDPQNLKKDFPILNNEIDTLDKKNNGQALVYLDNAATSQKPQTVISAISNYYQNHNANVGRSVHSLSTQSTQIFNQARQKVANFFKAEPVEFIPFGNTTTAINGLAYGWADHALGSDDVILVSLLEHHSNLVVWQQVCQRTGAQLEYVSLSEDGQLDLVDLKQKLQTLPVKLVALTHVSNTLGTLLPLPKIIQLARNLVPEAKILIDGAQAVSHLPIDFSQLDVDFYVFSGHKMLGPMGSGGLLVKKGLLETSQLKPWLFGGGMIDSVFQQSTNFNRNLKQKFIAGTPNVAGLVGLAAACDYLSNLGMHQVLKHDQTLVNYALRELLELSFIKLVGPVKAQPIRVGSVAFIHQQVPAHDVAQVLDSRGIAVRSGHHCCMPLHTYFDWDGTVRVSFSVYNAKQDVDALIEALNKVNQIFNL